MVLGQACGIAVSLADGLIQDVNATDIREIMQVNPYMDGSQADVIIDDGDPLITYSEGWKQAKSKKAYGPTFYALENTPAEAYVMYHLPDTLSGEWDIYAYQMLRGKANPVAHYSVKTSSNEANVTFDNAKLALAGQMSGEWFCLGTYNLTGGGKVTMTSDESELPLRSDALLLVKHK